MKANYESSKHLSTMAENDSITGLEATGTERLSKKTMDTLRVKPGEEARYKAGAVKRNN